MKTTKNKNLKSLDQFVDEQYGKRGTKKRETFEKGYEEFKLGFILQVQFSLKTYNNLRSTIFRNAL